MYLYSVYDKVQGEYAAPVVAVNDNVAKRWFKKVVASSGFDPMDFQLYKLGTFDTKLGIIVPEVSYVCNPNDLEGDILDE